jgi:hypothetical protein
MRRSSISTSVGGRVKRTVKTIKAMVEIYETKDVEALNENVEEDTHWCTPPKPPKKQREKVTAV